MDIFSFSGQLNSGKLIPLGEFTDSAANFFCGEAISIGHIGKSVPDFSDAAICLGDFDGVHLGHRRLFEIAKKYLKWGILVFDKSFKNTGVLTTLSEKLGIIRDLGASYAVVCELSKEVADSSPIDFVDFLADTLRVSAVVAGYDYRFGRGASGDSELLKKLCAKRNITAEIADAVKKDGKAIKSTYIRELVALGNLEEASSLLGREYSVSAEVQKGLQNGRKIGFPTANIAISPQKILPPDGVYYGRVSGRDAVINIGINLTFDAQRRTMEAHILDFDGDMYGAIVTAELIEKIRPVMKFDSADDLSKQINKDVEYIRRK